MLATNPRQHSLPPCGCLWPAPAIYRFGRRVEAVSVLALEPDGEVRILRSDGSIGRVPEHRVTLTVPLDQP